MHQDPSALGPIASRDAMCPTYFALFIALLLLLSATPCAALNGRVLDEATQKPLEGAFVIINRLANVPYGTEGRTTCVSYAVAKSDVEGKFSVSLPADLFVHIVGRVAEGIAIYKPGYRFTGSSGEGLRFFLRSDSRSLTERYEEMSSIAGMTDCASGAEKNEKAVPLLRAMYEELRTGATTPPQRQLARDWLIRIDSAEYGGEEAGKRKKTRDADLFSRCLRFARVDPMTGKREIVVREGVDRSDCDDQRPEPK